MESHLVLNPLLVIAVIVVFSVSTPYGNEVSEHGFRAGFFDLRLKDSERLLSAIGNGGQKQEALAVEFFAGGGALALRNAYDSYLTCRGGRAYFTVRTDATAKELWKPRILPDGTMALLSLASDRYLRVGERALWCDASSDKQAAKWEPHMATRREELHGAGRLYSVLDQDYFIMNPTLFNWSDIPPFIVGGVVFDNWLTSKAVIMGEEDEAMTLDATRTLI
ncbi:hypothetical protein DQ04_06881010 [Trypanosoma grayi]|uniref:hypothetical protein n=1 Tax=Trypanosoma grayi TaxID=71804 RepID=UPI0004F40B82|nr:hypothetical protein DQ04_06881010 [Trypanosoma grayi]KEG08575.1 hypothetical protein DQ04_06881010 [Trypanosoma grayi]